MELISKKQGFKVSIDVARKIMRDFKSEIRENRNAIQRLNAIDYEYNEKMIYVDDLIKAVDLFNDMEIQEKETKNLIVSYYGDPYVTIQILFSALFNCQIVNLTIEEMCLGVNKLIIELYKEILKEYRITDIVSLNSYVSKNDIEANKIFIDKMYCLGNRNFYNVCKNIKDLDIEYVPFNNIDIFCEDVDYYDLAEDIFNICFQNGIEAEIFDDIDFEDAVDVLNNYGENYCSIILTKNKEYMNKFKSNVNSKFVFVNENPFNEMEIYNIPKIF